MQNSGIVDYPDLCDAPSASPPIFVVGWARYEGINLADEEWLRKIYFYSIAGIKTGLEDRADPTVLGPRLTLLTRPAGGQVLTRELNLAALSKGSSVGYPSSQLDKAVLSVVSELNLEDYLVVVCPVSLYAPAPLVPGGDTPAAASPGGYHNAVSVTVINQGSQICGVSALEGAGSQQRLQIGSPGSMHLVELDPPFRA